MYRSESTSSDEVRTGKHLFLWVVAVLLLVSGAAWFFSRSAEVADAAIVHYEEFREIHRTCQKIDADLATIREVPPEDQMFNAFSKSAMLASKRQQMTRWVEEYNAKSRMWNRALWKSADLPYQLSTSDFSHYAN